MTLRNRHQTLSDLRSDLRARSQLLSRELLDLVNANYEDFLALGSTLRGGEERVEGVRVGVLEFGRGVEGVRDVVREREAEVRELIAERRRVRSGVQLGRGLLEVEERLGGLERRLMIAKAKRASEADEEELEDEAEMDDFDDDDDDVDDDDEDEEGEEDTSENQHLANTIVRRLRTHATLFLLLLNQIQRLGSTHPFLVAQQTRVAKIRETLLLDLGAAVKSARKEGSGAGGRMLKLAGVYRELGEGEAFVRAVRGA